MAKARIHMERYNETIKKLRLIFGNTFLSVTTLDTQGVLDTCLPDELSKPTGNIVFHVEDRNMKC